MTPTLYDPPAESTLAALGIESSNADALAIICEQGGAEWFTARLGIPTASSIANVITGSGEPTTGETRKSYLTGLGAERLTRTVESQHSTPAMERGHNLEPRARDWYEFTTGRDVQQVGFVYGDAARSYGCSPDGLCVDRVTEIKCPMRRAMIGTLLRGKPPAAYVSQIQCEMHVCGVDVCDFVLFTPEPTIPSQVWTVEACDKWRAAFPAAIEAFNSELDAAYERVAGML